MEAIASILTSPNALLVLVALFFMILLLAYLSRKGYFSFKGKGLVVGRDNEQQILREQLSFSNSFIELCLGDIPEDVKKAEYYRVKYVLSKVKDYYENIIVLNHVRLDDTYIGIKAYGLMSLLDKLTSDTFHTSEWHEYMRKKNKELLEKIYRIRKEWQSD